MFESNPYAMVGVAMIGQLHRVVAEKAEVAGQAQTPLRPAWRQRLSRLVANLWPRREPAQPYPGSCDQTEMGCI